MGSAITRANPQLDAGSGGARLRPSGVITHSVTSVGTDAATTEKILYTYSLPANTLNADGMALRITAFGSFAANANAKTVKTYFGGTAVISRGSVGNNVGWRQTVTIIRTAAGAQLAFGEDSVGNVSVLTGLPVTPAEDETGAIVIKVTGTNGAASENDIVLKGVVVECLQ